MVVSAGALAQVTWSVAEGKVTGARNVNVGGSFYDVEFGDTPVGEPLPVTGNGSFALAAATALVDQVFVSRAPLNLDSTPMALRGCNAGGGLSTRIGFAGSCKVFVGPTGTLETLDANGIYNFRIWTASNNPGGITVSDGVFPFSFGNSRNDPSTYAFAAFFDDVTVATWSTAAPVPEPETYALVLAGLGLTGAFARRRKAKQA
jgi:hypothetical protein